MRATSRRISRTRELGADSAHCRHSAARSLHFSGLSIATPSGDLPIRKIKPRLDRGDQRGFLRSASAGAKLFSKLGTYLIVPRISQPRRRTSSRSGCLLLSRVAINCLELVFALFEGAIDAPPGPDNTPDRPVSGIDKDHGVPVRWNDECLRPMPPFYRELRHRRRPAASSRYHFLRLGGYRIEYSAGRNSSKASGSRAGERGTFPSQRRVYRTRFQDESGECNRAVCFKFARA